MIVLEGPSGAGKTAAVYACAAELGLKVIEVNPAMPRAGRHVLASFGEWSQYDDGQGNAYWYNNTTGESSYDAPAGYAPCTSDA